MKNKHFLLLTLACFPGLEAGAQPARDTTLTIKESVISASKRTGGAVSSIGSVKISGDMARKTPPILGETDIVKTVQLLPGVNSGSEGFSGILVRGGGPDENMIQLDGVPIYSAGHMLGLFSVFQGEAVQNFTLLKGAFPARYGGRSSGILDVRTIDGDPVKTNASFGAGLISDKVHIDGPLDNGKTSYSISGRGMHTFLLDGAMRVARLPANYYFNDLHAKITRRIGGFGTLKAGFFMGKDNLHYKEYMDRTRILWGNMAASLNWTRVWDSGLESDIVIACSSYRTEFRFKSPGIPDDTYRTGIRDLMAKAGFSYSSIPGHCLRFGFEDTRHMFMPESLGNESSAYIEDAFEPWRDVQVEAGGRLACFHADGKTWWAVEPRVSASAFPYRWLRVQASYSKMSQYLHLLTSSQVILPIDLWQPVTKDIPPVTSVQWSLGIGIEPADGWHLSVEGYLKGMDGVIEYQAQEDRIATGKGRSKGLEFFFSKTTGKTSGWIGYAMSKTDRCFPDGTINGGKWFPYRYDIRHKVSIVSTTDLGRGWDAGAVWTWSTGGALRNGCLRLPPSHRLDLGLNHHKPKRGGERIWNVSIYNVYNRKNPNLVFESYGEEEDGPGSLKIISILPVIPSVSYSRVF